MRYIEGEHRGQRTLFPESLDECLTSDNQVRFLDEFVAHLDLVELGFGRCQPAATGRPGYNPADLLKLYLYGYLNNIRSSRKLERETHRNIEVLWLLCKLTPDFKTISDFRRDNGDAIKGVFRTFVQLCRKLELFGGEVVAIDGSKFKGVNSARRNFSRNRLQAILDKVDKSVQHYFDELDRNDAEEIDVPKISKEELEKHIRRLKEEREHLTEMAKNLQDNDESQVSLTDADSRKMFTQNGSMIGYNLQTAVDGKHKLIAAMEVTNDRNDRPLLGMMARKAKEALDLRDGAHIIADRGYFQNAGTKVCIDEGLVPWIPRQETSRNASKDMFTKRDFVYDEEQDHYRCPADQYLRPGSKKKNGTIICYKTKACSGCSIRERCTDSSRGRVIERWLHEHIMEEMDCRVSRTPAAMQLRRSIVEHPFGVMKEAMGMRGFSMKGLKNTNTEAHLMGLAYNMKRAINILGTKKLMAALA